MKRRGYDIGRVVDLIFEYWLGRMKRFGARGIQAYERNDRVGQVCPGI